mmetsp:Transcript_1637/g.4448  ORF Transcript_1637/g.4448 Transcript_1637/m.4448 type:complete len:246 (+) Transcript_1637:2079-2816(+)
MKNLRLPGDFVKMLHLFQSSHKLGYFPAQGEQTIPRAIAQFRNPLLQPPEPILQLLISRCAPQRVHSAEIHGKVVHRLYRLSFVSLPVLLAAGHKRAQNRSDLFLQKRSIHKHAKQLLMGDIAFLKELLQFGIGGRSLDQHPSNSSIRLSQTTHQHRDLLHHKLFRKVSFGEVVLELRLRCKEPVLVDCHQTLNRCRSDDVAQCLLCSFVGRPHGEQVGGQSQSVSDNPRVAEVSVNDLSHCHGI